MKYLVFLRGIHGSGKSTFIKENRLEPYTISSDDVRLLIKPPLFSVTGQTITSQKINRRVWGSIYSLIKCALKRKISQSLTLKMRKTQEINLSLVWVNNYNELSTLCRDLKEYILTLIICFHRQTGTPELSETLLEARR